MNFKKLALAATAFGMIAGGASAQQATVSVLERVLGAVNGTVADVGGSASVFANIASTNVDIVTGSIDGITPAVATIVGNIDGSVTAILSNEGLDPSANPSLTNVYEEINNAAGTTLRSEIDAITFDLGEIATTVLGAVNTGDMNLTGSVNTIAETITEQTTQATAGLSNAIDAAVTNTYDVTTNLLGDSTNPVLALNIADNVASVTGAVSITSESVNGAATGIATTVLGAVNTGTIAQNAAASAAGVVSTITGR